MPNYLRARIFSSKRHNQTFFMFPLGDVDHVDNSEKRPQSPVFSHSGSMLFSNDNNLVFMIYFCINIQQQTKFLEAIS